MRILSGALSILFFSLHTFAKEEDNFEQLLSMDLDALLEVEVATGTPKQLSEVPAVVSVIKAEQLKLSGVRTLSEAS